MKQQDIKAKNPKTMAPQRCVSAFNIFFMAARKRLVAENTDQGPYTRAEVYSIRLDKESRMEKSKRPHRKMHGKKLHARHVFKKYNDELLTFCFFLRRGDIVH